MMEDEKPQVGNLKPPLYYSSSRRDKEPSELEKLRKWQEERLERRLRGEYESAVRHLSEVIGENLDVPLKIAAVRVEGATHTRRSFLGFVVNPLLARPDAAGSLEAVLKTTKRISHRLHETDVFQRLEARIERARDVLADPDAVDIVLRAKERGRLYLNSSTELGNNEGSASATGRIRNVFGGGETLEASIAFGTKTRRSFRATLAAPLTPSLGTYGELVAYGLERDNSNWASSTEGLRGAKASVRHELAYEAAIRHIHGLTSAASISIRESAGQTVKSSVSHTYTIDTRDDRIAATKGFYARVSNELAGIGGDATFYKFEGAGQVSRGVTPNVSFSLAARTGFLWGFGQPTLFSDRFQLGGPLSVRAFVNNGLGPRDGVDSLGGDVYWSAGASVISNIPNRAHWPIKLHGWVNAGRLDALNYKLPLKTSLFSTLSQPSVSAGVGFIYRFDPVRMEVNFGVPLVASKSDAMQRGIQVGVGLEFL